MKVKQIITIMVIAALITVSASAGALFHAAEKRIAKRIAIKGFSSAKMKSTARFGKGAYLATTPKTALAEKPEAGAVTTFKHGKYLDRNSINLYRPSTKKLKELCPNISLQGKVKKGVIGQQLGKKLGKYASIHDKAIVYRSAKQPNGKNIFIPNQVYKRHPRIVMSNPDKVKILREGNR